MPAIKVADFAFPRMEAPDLDEMEEFLTHFGLTRAERTADALYMKGSDGNHHLHVTHKGGTKFIGLAYHATEDDLARLARLPGASGIETLNEPGGGKRVRLTEPNGYQIEVIAGLERGVPTKSSRDFVNSGSEPHRRAGRTMRLTKSPTPIQRIGHGVLATPKVKETVTWFRNTLGFIRSDDVYAGDKENVIGAFSRLDRGDDYVDHHVLFCVHNENKAGLNHVSYEAQDIDAIFQDHEHLKKVGKYEHIWGIGRHLLGSQVYDYWSDPWGRVHERWADSDRLNAANGGNLISAEEGLASQWGDRPSERFIGHASP